MLIWEMIYASAVITIGIGLMVALDARYVGGKWWFWTIFFMLSWLIITLALMWRFPLHGAG